MIIRGLLMRGPFPVLRTLTDLAAMRPAAVASKLLGVETPAARVRGIGRAMFQEALKGAIAYLQGESAS
jgi:hypothetical protein